MSSIFGDTDDITFGSAEKSARPVPVGKKEFFPREKSSVRPDSEKRNTYSPRPSSSLSRPDRGSTRKPGVLSVPEMPSLSSSLTSLVTSMKPSFLPNMPEGVMRLVLLSETSSIDPMMLVRVEDVTIIFGTGFSTLENGGKTYPTFPDMRLIASEKDRLAGWVLTQEGFDLQLFQTVLEMLGFPFVYATRDVIAYIRNNITDGAFIEKCRFFEIFTADTPERKIAHFLLQSSPQGLLIQSGGRSFIDGLHAMSDSRSSTSSGLTLTKDAKMYILGNEKYETGEIIDIVSSSRVAKQTLRFTFDTFYVDAGSIGVVAGYTLKDRSELANSGVITFVIEEDVRMRAIVGHIFIDSRGFVHSYEMMGVHKEIIKAIRHIYEATILANQKIERGELVGTLRRELTKYCYLLTGRTPVVMPVIIER